MEKNLKKFLEMNINLVKTIKSMTYQYLAKQFFFIETIKIKLIDMQYESRKKIIELYSISIVQEYFQKPQNQFFYNMVKASNKILIGQKIFKLNEVAYNQKSHQTITYLNERIYMALHIPVPLIFNDLIVFCLKWNHCFTYYLIMQNLL